ncbi:MAG: glucosamine-1-phosphate N-acetyltransferase [Chloroflexota bacterium]|nr:MAG: glucosamine-1-phosphate N-acetyltransferase [Chloroflexota bacterium]
MSADDTRTSQALKAVILAAGKESITSEVKPILLHNLGDRKVVDYVLTNALQLVPPYDLYIVVGYQQEEMRAHLGPGYQYISQEDQHGTGHAVLQLKPLLEEFHGDLLILYGDTPLFRPDSIRGLLNRHRLRQAHLTMLTAIVDRPYPYGRIIRDAQGQIIDIIEADEASQAVQEIRELNVGAYMVRADAIFSALKGLSPSPIDGTYRLTDCVHQLIRSGLCVESYQIYDQDEVQGINTAEDLEHAEFILQKRLFRPHRPEEENKVLFGTGGWRAIIGEGFTMYNVRRLTQALANDITRNSLEKRGVIIGYDRRFLSDRAAIASAEVFAGNNIPVTLLSEDVPTPLITYATALLNSAYGLVFTASHNPPEWNGLKVFHSDGSLLLDEETHQIEAETNRMTANEVVKLELDIALEAGIIHRRDMTNEYVDAVEKLIDLDVIRKANLKVIVDPMYGVGQLTLGIILTEARCRVIFIHERHNPLFGGRSPAPNMEALRLLITTIQEGGYDLGLATDGDADRIAIIDEKGRYIPTNDVLLLVYWYMHEVRGERGGVVRNLSTTHLLDRLAQHFGEISCEVPVGFKHIASGMIKHNALLGGESSGGLTVRGHILGKDGIFASALVVEMLARTGKRLSELQDEVWKITGRLYALEEAVPATPEMRVAIPKRLKEIPIDSIGSYPVTDISHVDGTKILMDNDNWALLRFSGTEPVLRLMVEADSPVKAQELIDWLKQFCSTAK